MKAAKKLVGLSLVMVAMCVGTSSASMLVNCNFVRPDFSGQVGTGQYGLVGTNTDSWNNLPVGCSDVALQDSMGNSSGLSLTEVNFTGSWFNDYSDSPYTIFYAYNETKKTDGTAHVAISGFSGGTYDLYVYDAFKFTENYTTYTINGVSKVASNVPVSVTSFVEGQNYVVFEDVTPVDGQIVLTVTASTVASTTSGSICALQLAQVPEPAMLSLLAIGGFWLRRRK